jgi:hypothetical protein
MALSRHLPCNQSNILDGKASEGIQPIPVGKDASGSFLTQPKGNEMFTLLLIIGSVVILLLIMSWSSDGTAPSFLWSGWKNELLGALMLGSIVFGLLYVDDLFRFLAGK